METIIIEVAPITYVPPHTHGDREFKGQGPRVVVNVTLYVANDALWARVYMKARELQEDFTTAEGAQDYTLYSDRTRRVVDLPVDQDRVTEWQYIDNDEEEDVSPIFPAFEPVKQFVCLGDVQGTDAGAESQVTVYFNPIKIAVEEVGRPIKLPIPDR